MAIGDDAAGAGFPLVPGSGTEDAKVRFGAREINRTRDLIAQVKQLLPAVWPVEKGGTGGTTKIAAKTNLGITYGTLNPVGGTEGDIYLKII